ncbi:MAG: hypothetical protein ACFFEU_12060 [Candidatus Thorarchaeota archaeon]
MSGKHKKAVAMRGLLDWSDFFDTGLIARSMLTTTESIKIGPRVTRDAKTSGVKIMGSSLDV